jgi:nucleotide-binding universal stress UspA family protein
MVTTTALNPSPGASDDAGTRTAPVSLGRILVALDASDHANHALRQAIKLAATADGVITGIHAYAAKLHDRRFKQMEGGLPERYRKEEELENQREVHDSLITRGLNIISDSYHDFAQAASDEAGRPYRRLSPEGKNYRRIVEATRSGDFDLLVLGALGLGAVPGAVIGTVCERVVRRAPIDALIIRGAERAIGDGPIVVGLDGSALSFGALKTALELARKTGAEVHAVAAYDPYYHYVAFNRIAEGLSEEASQEFRFKEQEKLHEEIIDSGIAKIYQSHLEVGRSLADDDGVEITCELLDGKPYRAIGQYLEKVGASLLLLGKTGIHADAELDIGGNAENLMRMAPCHVWLGQTPFTPPLEAIARETITWTEEAEVRMEQVPEAARAVVRMGILGYAQKSGHTVITSALIEEATRLFCPERGRAAPKEETGVEWSDEATRLLDGVTDASQATAIRLRAEKHARRNGAAGVTAGDVRPFLGDDDGPTQPVWTAEALARLARVPEMAREAVRQCIEGEAREQKIAEITPELAEAGLARTRETMEAAMDKGEGGCPFADLHGPGNGGGKVEERSAEAAPFTWTPEAEARLAKVPEGFIRELSRQRIEAFAKRKNVTTITPELIGDKYAEWGVASARQKMTLEWTDGARKRIERIPEFVRGMVILEVERRAREMGKASVTDDVIDQVSGIWETTGAFHSDADPDLYKKR